MKPEYFSGPAGLAGGCQSLEAGHPRFFHRGKLVTLIEISVGIGVNISNQYSLFQVTHIMAKWFPEDNIEEKPKDFISKFLTGLE